MDIQIPNPGYSNPHTVKDIFKSSTLLRIYSNLQLCYVYSNPQHCYGYIQILNSVGYPTQHCYMDIQILFQVSLHFIEGCPIKTPVTVHISHNIFSIAFLFGVQSLKTFTIHRYRTEYKPKGSSNGSPGREQNKQD